MSLEPISNLGVVHGVVYSFSLVFIISSFMHFVVVCVVSSSSFIPSFPFLGICKLEWIIVTNIESLKVRFTMYFLQTKDCKVLNL